MTRQHYDRNDGAVIICEAAHCTTQLALGHPDGDTPMAELARDAGWAARWHEQGDIRDMRFYCPEHKEGP